MGQYYKGDKIGTCENMYYLKLEEAREMARMGLADDDGISFDEYLKDGLTRFRFPWPDEDKESGPFVKREPFKTFTLPCGEVKVNHDEIVIHNTHEGGGYGLNIWIPCPHDSQFNLKTSNNGAGEQFLTVKFQAVRDGAEKTIFGCARCKKLQRFSDDDVQKIKARAIEYYSAYKRENEAAYQFGGDKHVYEHAMAIIERIR